MHYTMTGRKESNRVADSMHETAEETNSNGKPILLVVEDNPEIREYILDSLSGSFHVITAGEGKEGCNAAFTHIPISS
jgi:hypothetical protein